MARLSRETISRGARLQGPAVCVRHFWRGAKRGAERSDSIRGHLRVHLQQISLQVRRRDCTQRLGLQLERVIARVPRDDSVALYCYGKFIFVLKLLPLVIAFCFWRRWKNKGGRRKQYSIQSRLPTRWKVTPQTKALANRLASFLSCASEGAESQNRGVEQGWHLYCCYCLPNPLIMNYNLTDQMEHLTKKNTIKLISSVCLGENIQTWKVIGWAICSVFWQTIACLSV